jgi:molybdopterin-synthase adenylyltransferase
MDVCRDNQSQLDQRDHRYHRQQLLPDFGEAGQARLGAAHAVILGCGALGCTVADQLARAGVGRLTLIDRDVVELTNLQRQVLFDESSAAASMPKAEAARVRLAQINSTIRIDAHIADFHAANAARLCSLSEDSDGNPPDILLDGTDNFEARLLLNDLAIKHAVPYVYAGAVGTRGMQMTILPGGRPCLRCLVDQPPVPGVLPTCDTAGVLGPVISIVAGVQAAEAIKLLVGRRDLVSRSLLEFDIWKNERRRIDLSKSDEGGGGGGCTCCGEGRFDYLEGRLGQASARLCGQHSVQIMPAKDGQRVDLDGLARRLKGNAGEGSLVVSRFMLRVDLAGEVGDDGNAIALTIFGDGRTIVRGTTQVNRARSLVARYFGG